MKHNHAFTLVELSIVLVILGLLTGGILTGQSLIRAAELRSIIVEKDRYSVAVQTFRDKYRAIPGDIKMATSFWGDQASCNSPSIPDGTPGTCNGNGDGKIAYMDHSTPFPFYETLRFWEHLSLAGLIEGSYPTPAVFTMWSANLGLASGPATYLIPAYHSETVQVSPTSRAMNARWFTSYNPHLVQYSMTSGVAMFVYNYGHFLLHGRSADNAGKPIYVSSMKPEEVWNIDNKTDDGRPGVGNVLVYPVGCTTTADETQGSTAEYLLSSTTGQCGVVFANAY